MKLTIETDQGTLLRLDGETVLVPSIESERALAFEALTRALSLLAWIRRPDATADEKDQYSKAKGRSADLRGSGVVVPLRSP